MNDEKNNRDEEDKQNIKHKEDYEVLKNSKLHKSKYKTIAAWAFATCLVAFLGIFIAFKITNPSKPKLVYTDEEHEAKTQELPEIVLDGEIAVVATQNTENGIDINSNFIIKTQENLTKKELEKRISVTPEENFKISKNGDKFTLEFNEPLEYDKIYNIEYSSEGKKAISFAFQTIRSFSVISTLPKNKSKNIPINSGIELYFNEESEEDILDYLKFEPKISGKTEKKGRGFVFIPNSLEKDNVYNVTIKKGFKGLSGKELEKDYTFSFDTASEPTALEESISFANTYQNVSPQNNVSLALNLSSYEFKNNSFDVEIFKLKDKDSYVELLNNNLDSANLESIYKTSANVVQKQFYYGFDSFWDEKYMVNLDKTLDEGYYLAKVSTEYNSEILNAEIGIQSSDLAVAAISYSGDIHFWVNDIVTGKAVEGAEIKLLGETLKTDKSGLAKISVAENTKNNLVEVKYGSKKDHPFLLETLEFEKLSAHEKYYSYLYMEKYSYKPTDVLHIFGYLKEIYPDDKINNSDSLQVEVEDIAIADVKLDKYGAFNIEIPFENIEEGYKECKLTLNEDVIGYFDIDIREKNNLDRYIFIAETDKNFYAVGENVEITITASTLDGLPITAAKILEEDKAIMETDDFGKVVINLKAENENTDSQNYGSYNYKRYYLNNSENSLQTASVSYKVFPSDIALNYERLDNGDYKLKASYVDLENLNKFYQTLETPPDIPLDKDLEISVELKKSWTEKILIDEQYDYIEKKNTQKYNYVDKSEIIESTTVTIRNAEAILVNPLKNNNDRNSNYSFELKYKDFKDTFLNTNIPIYDFYSNQEEEYPSYSFENINEGTSEDAFKKYKIDEDVHLRVKSKENPDKGFILGLLLKEKVFLATTATPQDLTYKFKENYKNNISVVGLYFDGNNYHNIQRNNNYYDFSDKKLNLEINTNKDIFSPNEDMFVEVKVTDSLGKPKKSLVNLSLINENIKNSYEGFNFLENFHTNNYSSFYKDYTQYLSHTPRNITNDYFDLGTEEGYYYHIIYPFSFSNVVEKTPYFKNIETDNNGIAKIPIKLPDAVSNWQIVVHAVAEDESLGSNFKNIYASKTLYIDVVISENLVEGDEAYAFIKAFGENIKPTKEKFRYSAKLYKEGTPITNFSGTQTGIEMLSLSLLDAGNYTFEVTAESGKNKDSKTKEFTVLKSRAKLPIKENTTIEKGNSFEKPNTLEGNIEITASNKKTETIKNLLDDFRYNSSNRTDFSMAKKFSYYLDNQFYQHDEAKTLNDYAKDLELNWNYGLGETSYDTSDIFFTARFASAYPEIIDKEALRDFVDYRNFENENAVLEDLPFNFAKAEEAAGYMALSAAKEPVLIGIKTKIKEIREDENQEQYKNDYYGHMTVLFYASALCNLGDHTLANNLLKEYPIMDELYNSTNEFGNLERKEYIDTMMFFINSTLNQNLASDYITNKEKNSFVSDINETVNFIRKLYVGEDITSKITYNLNGKNHEKLITNYEVFNITIPKEYYNDFDMKVSDGVVAVDSKFSGDSSNLINDKNIIDLNKTITKDSDSIYTVRLEVNFPEGNEFYGYYNIIDYIPSNMIYYENISNNSFYSVYNDDSSINISYDYNTKSETNYFEYKIMRISDSKSIDEDAYISKQFGTLDIWGKS